MGDRRKIEVDEARRQSMASAIARNPDLPDHWHGLAARLGEGQIPQAAVPPAPRVRLFRRPTLRILRILRQAANTRAQVHRPVGRQVHPFGYPAHDPEGNQRVKELMLTRLRNNIRRAERKEKVHRVAEGARSLGKPFAAIRRKRAR